MVRAGVTYSVTGVGDTDATARADAACTEGSGAMERKKIVVSPHQLSVPGPLAREVPRVPQCARGQVQVQVMHIS